MDYYNNYSRKDADYNSGQTGSYTNTHQSGKRYHGKGSYDRAEQSAKEKEELYNDPVISIDWTPANDDHEAFIDEANRLWNDGGHRNPDNYNKRDSPGGKYLEEAASFLTQAKEKQKEYEEQQLQKQQAEMNRKITQARDDVLKMSAEFGARQLAEQQKESEAIIEAQRRSSMLYGSFWMEPYMRVR